MMGVSPKVQPFCLLHIDGYRCAQPILRLHTCHGLLRRSVGRCYMCIMTTAEDIEKAVEQLPPGELARFRTWFEAFDAAQFDAAIERDARAGKLDTLADEAVTAHCAGTSREL